MNERDPFDVEPQDEPLDFGNPKMDDLADEARAHIAEERHERGECGRFCHYCNEEAEREAEADERGTALDGPF
jgi:hypothetical protein